ncbi:MAG: hypothetical protein R2788_02950 [Saprospiraceae bacterium]
MFAQIKTVDPDATKQTKALFASSKKYRPNRCSAIKDIAYGYKWNDWHKKNQM